MHRNDMLRTLANRCRMDATASLFVVGWFAAVAPDEDLERLLAAVEELSWGSTGQGHLEAYRERYGRLPKLP
jgi:hypothetical protein